MKIIDDYWESYASDERKLVLKQNRDKLPADTLDKLSPSNAFKLQYVTNGPMYWNDPEYDCSWLLDGCYWDIDGLNHLWTVIFSDYDIMKIGEIDSPVFLSLGKHDYAAPYTLWDKIIDAPGNNLKYLTCHLFDESGHYPMIEERELFDEKLINWIKEN